VLLKKGGTEVPTTLNLQTSLKRVNSDKKNPKSNSLTIARHLPVEIRKLLVIKEANLE
jgi:hypothetical protein